MSNNTNLMAAKERKYDEFFTLLQDVEDEVGHYTDQLAGKTIYLPCDSTQSNFYRYFKREYMRLRLKGLYATCYNPTGRGTIATYDGIHEAVKGLEGDGDFRSPECIEIMKMADVVVTNPPFSLFREFIDAVVDCGKDFLVVGTLNCATYKNIFPLIRDNKVRFGVGYKTGGRFQTNTLTNTAEYGKGVYVDESVVKFGFVRWLTTLVPDTPNGPIPLVCRYNEAEYPRYDNYDAIEVRRVKRIPRDFDGVIGVPYTFLDFYDPEQFEIIAAARPRLHGRHVYARLLIRKRADPRPKTN